MDVRDEFADEIMTMIESYYPDFLAETGVEDSLMIKTGFYGAMIATVSEAPLPDIKVQEVVLGRLGKLYDDSMEKFKEEFRNSLFKR